jgi:hypothetical protein
MYLALIAPLYFLSGEIIRRVFVYVAKRNGNKRVVAMLKSTQVQIVMVMIGLPALIAILIDNYISFSPKLSMLSSRILYNIAPDKSIVSVRNTKTGLLVTREINSTDMIKDYVHSSFGLEKVQITASYVEVDSYNKEDSVFEWKATYYTLKEIVAVDAVFLSNSKEVKLNMPLTQDFEDVARKLLTA